MIQHHDHDGACSCGLIDVHAHCLSTRYRQALTDAGLLSLDGGYPIPDWSSQSALEVMDRDGIDTMLLSVTSPTVSFLKTAGERVKLARQINEELAQTAKDHPGRFGGFVTLPLPHVAECVAEVRYALDELKLDGVIIETNADGRYLGDPQLEPIFAELDERRAKVFLHPTTPACFEKVGLQRPAPLFEFPVDTGRTIVDMIFAGTFERYPNVSLIVPHAGGVLPSIAHRIALLSGMPVMKPAPKPGADVIRVLQRLYYDLAMSANQATFDSLRTLAPLSQILYGTDFPFQSSSNVQANSANFRKLKGLSLEEHIEIARSNALRLFPQHAHGHHLKNPMAAS